MIIATIIASKWLLLENFIVGHVGAPLDGLKLVVALIELELVFKVEKVRIIWTRLWTT